jgi:hypothetical protein
VAGFVQRFGVELLLDGGAGSGVGVALSGLFSSLEHSGRQMLGFKSRGLLSPEHEGVTRRWA